MALDTTRREPPRRRRMDFPFDDQIPRHWFAGLALPTHVANGVNLLFPAGERFFVRSVKYYLDRFEDDPEMMAEIRGFFGQEGQHAREHERFFEILEAQGYRIRDFLDRYEHITFDVILARMPPALRLAATAACEHFTATLAENAFQNQLLEAAHPVLRGLLLWHAAEEIEHKAVAFDVLARVRPGYALRMAGMVLAAALLAAWWVAATRMLLAQDGVTRAQLARERAELAARGRRHRVWKQVFWRGIRDYVRPRFHPLDHDNRALAADYLASIGRAEG